ncbi:uncharacterized protein BJ212DRAFT_1302780 [Suillus subaureus]|uniref:Uncharacterized protein n=1 Tax=Suillus subaureus TaxID=48587 RepID=A0A9P7E1P3_9AGAM|nr:uncharacterized protein BJ212DRAFT_1302780 [Suillus subaureus]KAG1808877.1 hypothetical protein BJ212DRAFT_1302780 [Suillus subaureus]
MGENSKADNLDKWDSGKTKVGWDGEEAHAFYLTSKTDFGAFPSNSDFDSLYAPQSVVFGTTCCRYTSISCMDGQSFAYHCKDKPHVMQCVICGPTTHIHHFALDAIKEPQRKLATGCILVPNSSSPPESQGQAHTMSTLSQNGQALFSVGSRNNQTGNSQEAKFKLVQSRVSRLMSTPSQILIPSSSPTTPSLSNIRDVPFSNRSQRNPPFTEMQHTIQPSRFTVIRFMGRLKGCCPFHFASGNGFWQEHSNCEFCHLADGDYLGFKHLFKFQNYSNCFHCGLPQSNNHNAEEPACHSGFKYHRGQKCEFASFIFKVVYALWTSENATLLAPTLGLPKGWDSQEEFNHWVIQEDKENGRYINLLEIFIAFCTELEESDLNYFM